MLFITIRTLLPIVFGGQACSLAVSLPKNKTNNNSRIADEFILVTSYMTLGLPKLDLKLVCCIN